jgi:hypothetical protein
MVFIPIVLLLTGLIGFFAWKSHQRTIETWRQAGAELGLAVSVGKGMSRPTLSGNIGGHPVHIDTYTQRSGNSSTTYTRYRVGYPPLGLGLSLKREGAFSVITKLFGAQDVTVGDTLFDDAFTVKTSDPQRLRSLLTPSVRTGLLRLLATYGSAVVADDHIQITRARFESKQEVLTSTIQRMVATARLLKSPSAGVSDQMVIDRERGLLEEVADRVRELVEAEPDDVDQRIFEVETLAAAGRNETAAERLRELDRLAPADPDVAGWRESLTHGTTPTPAPAAVDVNQLARELFGGDDLSFETRSKFNSRYADATITWQGTVKSLDERGGVVRVLATVATVSNDLYGNTDIDVVVENPAGIRPTVGAAVTVTGKLTSIDPLMRNLFVSEARLS